MTPAISGTTGFSGKVRLKKVLLYCGMLSSLLYVGINIFVPMQWAGYRCTTQTVSELSAIGAPTRQLWVWLCVPYTLLVTAFAWGVWKSTGRNRSLRIAGGLMIIYGALGVIWPFAPMHFRETLAAGGATWSDSLHIALGAVTEILYLLWVIVLAMSILRADTVHRPGPSGGM